jgi:hypothetical protein
LRHRTILLITLLAALSLGAAPTTKRATSRPKPKLTNPRQIIDLIPKEKYPRTGNFDNLSVKNVNDWLKDNALG